MPIVKQAGGVVMVVPDKVNTVADRYTMSYGKRTRELYEKKYKEAEREVEFMELDFKGKMAVYQKEVAQQERELAALDKLELQYLNKEVDDAYALQRLGISVATANARAKAKREEAVAQETTIRPGGTTVRETSGTRAPGGRGAGLPDLSPSSAAQRQVEDYKKSELGANPSPATQLSMVTGTVGPQGRIQATDPEDARRVVGQEAARFAAQKEGEYIASGKTPEAARAEARKDAADIVALKNPAMRAGVEKYFGEMDAVAASTPGGTGGALSSTSTTTTPGQVRVKASPDLPAEAPQVTGPEGDLEAYSRDPVLAALADKRRAIESREITAPRLPMLDIQGRARQLYREAYGPVESFPAYKERQMTAQILDLTPEQQAEITRLFDAYATQQAAALDAEVRRTPEKDAIVAQVTDDAAALAPARFGESGMGEAFPYEAEIVAAESGPQRPPAPPPPPPEPEDPETRALRLRAQAAARAREVARRRADIQAVLGQNEAERAAVEGMFAEYDAVSEPQSGRMKAFMEAVPYMPMTAPPQPRVQTLPQRTPPEQRPAPVIMPRVNTDRAAELALLGVKPEGELMQVPPAAPSTAMAAPKQAARLDLRTRPDEGLTAEQSQMKTGEVITDAERGPKPPKPTLSARIMDETQRLVEDPTAFDKATRSGPGAVALKVYTANRKTNIPLSTTIESVTVEMGDALDARVMALAVVYAAAMRDAKKTNPTEE